MNKKVIFGLCVVWLCFWLVIGTIFSRTACFDQCPSIKIEQIPSSLGFIAIFHGAPILYVSWFLGKDSKTRKWFIPLIALAIYLFLAFFLILFQLEF